MVGVAAKPPPITTIFLYLLKMFRTVALFNFRNKQGGTLGREINN